MCLGSVAEGQELGSNILHLEIPDIQMATYQASLPPSFDTLCSGAARGPIRDELALPPRQLRDALYQSFSSASPAEQEHCDR
jgi:hypothetical protein